MTALDQTQASPAPQPTLQTLLVTDLVDSTKLVESLGDERAAEVLAQHDRRARDLLGRYAGREIDKTDGFLFLFERPIDAALYAVAFQDALSDLSAQLDVSLSARAGVHLGEVVLIENSPQDVARGAKPLEVEGLAKPIAARIMSLASGGQTLLSKGAFDLARRGAVGSKSLPDDLRWLEHGPYLFKGVSEPITVCEVGRKGCAPLRPPPNSEKVKRALAPGDEETLGWRPAPELAVPGREGWKLERRLGFGGFGEVWLAEQKRTHEQRAFKFCFRADRLRSLKRELTLFKLIKEVLGDRSDIVRLYEVHLDQAPFYLEMEYAAEGDLPGWAESQGGLGGIDLNTRLEVVAQVADALSAAHSVGVIHKDVKPSNIVLDHETADGRLQARLSDFGIGQLMDKESLEQAGVTVTGFSETMTELDSRTGTRLYMAPELLAGKPASIQSDIYALGVLLYQVVVGDLHRPVAQGWEGGVQDELLREDIAACVAGDPAARFSGADLLARNLRSLAERHRQREAERKRVVAEARRRRLLRLTAVSAGVLGLLALAFGWGYWNAERQRRRAEAAEGRAKAAETVAEKEARIAGLYADFLDDTLSAIDPGVARGMQNVVLEDLFERAARRVSELDDEPEAEAAVRTTLGKTFLHLGQYDDARLHLERALEIWRGLGGEDDANVAKCLHFLAWTLMELNDYAAAETLYGEALTLRMVLFGERSLEAAATLNDLGVMYTNDKDYRAAEPLLRRALEIRRANAGVEPADLVESLATVGNLVRLTGGPVGLQEAETLYGESLVIAQRELKGHPSTVSVMNQLGLVLRDRRKFAEAEALLRDALNLRREILPPTHPHVGVSSYNLALVLRALQRYEEAIGLHLEAIDVWKGRPREAAGLIGLAETLRRSGDLEGAEARCREGLALSDSPEARYVLGRILMDRGDLNGAKRELGLSLDGFKSNTPESWKVARGMAALGGCLLKLEEYEQAEPLLRDGYERLEALRSDEDEYAVEALRWLDELP